MSRRYQAAVVQLRASADKLANLEKAGRLIEAAVAAGAKLIALPELFNLYGRFESIVSEAEAVPGPTSDRLSAWAAQHAVCLVGGSFAERDEASGKARNTSLIFAPDGRILGRYSKVHLFDIDLPGRVTSKESDWIAPGTSAATTETALGRIGQAICYDLRFPELFRRLSADGAEVIVVPSAFTHTTGRDHWEILVRARAIENQCYVLAPNQCGEPAPGMRTYGHSMIVDPWGRMLASLDEEEGYAIAEIDIDALATVRAQLPALAHRAF
ncbi:MAG TPA: carbon-nitrogen hydrolase family protein [Pirellulales bacterium]|jgi:predicted amidohydrolase|nr:carbon-nitrogen hydrolase family protein [Pirellulales bacterium]